MSKEIEQFQAENIENFLEHGPGLRYSYHTWIVAKDTVRKRVLLGGLGGLGVGEMWREEQPEHRKYPSYAEAPEKDSSGQFGTSEWRENISQ